MTGYSGMGTEDIIEEMTTSEGIGRQAALEYIDFMEKNPEYFQESFKDVAEADLYGSVSKMFDEGEVKEFTPEDFGEPRIFRIGCDYKGIKTIIEKENENVYIPSSDYCMLKCMNKFFELIGSKLRLTTKYFSPYAPSLKKLQELILALLIPCENKCKVNPNSYPGTMCSKECKQEKRDKLSKLKLPQVYKVWYDKEKDKVYTQMTTKSAKIRDDYFIGLCHVGGNEYHAILLKTLNLKKEDITFELREDRELNVDFVKNKKPLYKDCSPIAISYDIETYTQDDILKKNTGDIEVKRLRPYALGYSVLDMQNLEVIQDYKEIIIDNKEDNLFDKFFNEIKQLPYNDIQIFAHNGGKFDNIYAKEAKTVKFQSVIAKGGQIKQLVVETEHLGEKKIYKMKDTLPFVLQSLKVACKMFNTSVKKLDFDIVDKSYEWYEEHKESKDPKTDWRQYLRNDVESLADLMLKIEQAYNKFGTSILWATGLAGLAYHMMNSYCLGMRKLYVPKDPSMVAFCRASIYGGRVLQWKRFYDMCDSQSEGMISIDMNSLYPSAMWMGSFPYGEPKLIQNENLKTFNDFPHYIVLATIKIPNIRYAYHPYKTDDGALIYPSNCIVKGVYNDVDLREMMKDGYEVLNVEKGIFWDRSKRIFTNFIKQLYDERNHYKKLGEDHPEYPLEYVIKIILNSTYGKFNETVRQTNTFSDVSNKQFKTNKGKIEREVILANGQKEIITSLNRISISKPSYIGGYVTAYSRAIVNEIIRTVGTDNIYYSDTDSIYLEKRILTEKNLPCSSVLGGFKNDYGENMVIRKAIFLDMKRYYLEFEDRKFNPPKITYKAKFNGLAFKQLDTIKDFMYEPVDYKSMTEMEKMELTEKMYLQLLDNYNKRSTSPYHMVNYDKILSREESINSDKQKENNRLRAEWDKENIKDMKLVTEFWNRGKTEVLIHKKELQFVIDPNKRGQWIDGNYYAIGYDLNELEYQSKCPADIGKIKRDCEQKQLDNFSKSYPKGQLYMKVSRPLIVNENMVCIEKMRDKIAYYKDDKKFRSNIYIGYEQEGNRLINEKIFYIDDNDKKDDEYIGFEVNGFGRLNKFKFVDINQIPYYKEENNEIVKKFYHIFPLIMLKGTDDNIRKYGSNFITEEEAIEILEKIRKL